jgi:hypothetical protein
MVMNRSDAQALEFDNILELLREFHTEAKNIIAHLAAIDSACQVEMEHSAN